MIANWNVYGTFIALLSLYHQAVWILSAQSIGFHSLHEQQEKKPVVWRPGVARTLLLSAIVSDKLGKNPKCILQKKGPLFSIWFRKSFRQEMVVFQQFQFSHNLHHDWQFTFWMLFSLAEGLWLQDMSPELCKKGLRESHKSLLFTLVYFTLLYDPQHKWQKFFESQPKVCFAIPYIS